MALVTKNFSDIITFTRASTGTYFNSSGVLTSAAINNPRFDYNPSTLAAQGLLIEEARTNFFTNTATAASATVGTGTVTGPDNALCRTLIPTAGAVSFPNITGPVQTFTLSLGQTIDWAMSGWVAAGPVGTITLEPHFSFGASASATLFTYAEFQVNTSNWTVRNKTYGSGFSEVSAPTITLFRPGLYRFTWVVRYTQDATARNSVAASTQARNTSGSGTYTADGVSGVQYALLQAETGSFVTSTIPTTTTALTRNSDVAAVNTLSPWYNATEGTLYVEMQKLVVETSGFPRAAALHDGTISNTIQIVWNNSVSRFYGDVQVGAVSQADLGANGTPQTNVNKIAFGYKTNDFGASVNGASATTDVSGNVPSGITTFRLGASAGGTGQINGYLRRITYYPTRLSNAQLQTITT